MGSRGRLAGPLHLRAAKRLRMDSARFDRQAPSVVLIARFFARRAEKQILRSPRRPQDDMSFRVRRSGSRNLLLVEALGRAVV